MGSNVGVKLSKLKWDGSFIEVKYLHLGLIICLREIQNVGVARHLPRGRLSSKHVFNILKYVFIIHNFTKSKIYISQHPNPSENKIIVGNYDIASCNSTET